jgi:hypothetical protein
MLTIVIDHLRLVWQEMGHLLIVDVLFSAILSRHCGQGGTFQTRLMTISRGKP